MALSRNEEEISSLEKLVKNINSTMINFNESTGKQQNEEQRKGLETIKKDFISNQIEPDLMYFIGRFKKVPGTTDEDVKSSIANQLGIPLSNGSAIKIESSRDPSMVKVSINGRAVNNYISSNMIAHTAPTKEESKTEEKEIILKNETIQNILHALSWNKKEWTAKPSQVVSPAYSPNDPVNASTEMEKLKGKFKSIGINTGKELIFLVDSQTETGKEKIAVDIKEFNKQLNPEKLEKLKSLLEKIKKDWDELETTYKDYRTDTHIGNASGKALEGIESDLKSGSSFVPKA